MAKKLDCPYDSRIKLSPAFLPHIQNNLASNVDFRHFIKDLKYFKYCQRKLIDWYYVHQQEIDATIKSLSKGSRKISLTNLRNVFIKHRSRLRSSEISGICFLLDTELSGEIVHKHFVHRIIDVYNLVYQGLIDQFYAPPDTTLMNKDIVSGKEDEQWVDMKFIFAPYSAVCDHPFHFFEVLKLSTTIGQIKILIHRRTGLPRQFYIFYSPYNYVVPLKVQPTSQLGGLGYLGGSKTDPITAELVFDFNTNRGGEDHPEKRSLTPVPYFNNRFL